MSYKETDANNENLTSGQIPEKESDAFAARLKQAIGDVSVRAFSLKSGVSESTLRAYLTGNSDPSRRALVAMARAADVSVGWLATGEEPVDQASEEEHAYRLKMMLDTIETVEENCIKKNMHMEPKEKALLIKRIYEYLLKYEKNDADKEAINDLINLAS